MELGNLSGWNFVVVFLGAYYILVFAGFLRKRLRQKQKSKLPPGHMGWSFIGNTLSFLRAYKSQNPEAFLNTLKQRYGATGIYKSNLFWNSSIIVCNPELCRKVLTDDKHFAPGYNISFVLLGGKGLDIISGPGHKRFRRLATGGINGTDTLSTYIENIEKIVINSLEELAKMKQPIEFLSNAKLVAFKLIMNIYLGLVSDNYVIESLKKYYEYIFRGLFSTPINFPGFAYHRALKARKMLIQILQDILTGKREKESSDPNTKKCLIDLIRDEIENEEGEKVDDKLIVIVLVFLLAGSESVGRAITWAITFLYQNPQVLQNAKEEQEEIIKRRHPSQQGLTLSEIKQMKYLSKVIDETIRMRGNPFTLLREVVEDTELNGYFIPKGWKVFVFQGAVHMDPEIHSNPQQFLPSRWDDFKPKAGTFQPFGAGSRVCPGSDLGKLEISIFLHYFLLNYKFEQLNPRSPLIHLPTTDPIDNCRAKITKLR